MTGTWGTLGGEGDGFQASGLGEEEEGRQAGGWVEAELFLPGALLLPLSEAQRVGGLLRVELVRGATRALEISGCDPMPSSILRHQACRPCKSLPPQGRWRLQLLLCRQEQVLLRRRHRQRHRGRGRTEQLRFRLMARQRRGGLSISTKKNKCPLSKSSRARALARALALTHSRAT